jgi:hypothetical protein
MPRLIRITKEYVPVLPNTHSLGNEALTKPESKPTQHSKSPRMT